MKVQDRLIVTIDALDHQGRGIAHLEGKTIFVYHALIGETVEIEVLTVKKRIVEAKVIQLLNSSKERIQSSCPYFEQCGGCDLLHMSYQKQLEYKENKVKEIMKKFAGIEGVVEPIIANEKGFGYRNKVVFQVKHKIGFYKKKSSEIVEIEKCLLLSPKMNQILSIIRESIDLEYVNQIMIRDSATMNDTMMVLEVENEFSVKQIPIEKFSNLSILIHCHQRYEVIIGNPFIREKVGNLIFKISPESFFQVNTKQMENLYQCILEQSFLTGNEKILDLYCGTGTIGMFLSKNAKEVLGIEINEQAVKDAYWNKEQNCISNIQFLCGDTGTILTKTSFQPDLVIVDPPRAGLDELAILELEKINSPKIIYVSCDPVTLARDLKRLEKRYEVTKIIPVDMFSNTYHVECVSLLSLKKRI